jgi:2,4-dienoyl-CoA reductase-like NADH-dependent reductase (Old Yellow Enzyme family)
MSELFSPFKLRELTFKNRIFVSPMCQYSSDDGLPTDWHLVHLGSRAVGGAALVMVEATAVSPEGRISLGDSGIWSDAHAEAFKRITKFIKGAGSVPAMQLAHAGRKASTDLPWRGGKSLSREAGGWQTMGPSAIAFEGYATPREMTIAEIDRVVGEFSAAARRALHAGFEVVEIHSAHGYLLHEFLSPISNLRRDEYGGSLQNQMRFPLRVAAAVRENWPANLPVLVRISATDWTPGGWDLPQSVEYAKELKSLGIDLIDCSSGGNVASANIPLGPGYQVQFAAAIRREAAMPTGAVGMITEPAQAEELIAGGKADVVLLARALLRDPYWPLHAADALEVDVEWPKQYVRAKGKR